MKNLCHDNDSVKGCSEASFHLHRSKAASEPPLIRGWHGSDFMQHCIYNLEQHKGL